MNLKAKFLIDHSHKNIINMEGSSSSDNSSINDDCIDSDVVAEFLEKEKLENGYHSKNFSFYSPNGLTEGN